MPPPTLCFPNPPPPPGNYYLMTVVILINFVRYSLRGSPCTAIRSAVYRYLYSQYFFRVSLASSPISGHLSLTIRFQWPLMRRILVRKRPVPVTGTCTHLFCVPRVSAHETFHCAYKCTCIQ